MLRTFATRPSWRSFLMSERSQYRARLRSTTQKNRVTSEPATIARTSSTERPRGTIAQALSLLGLSAGVFIALHIFVEHFYELSLAYGISMLPTINSYGDTLLTSKWYRRGRGIQIGDLVSYTHPIKRTDSAVKRVLGMPGDFVLKDTPGEGQGRMIQIPAGHCWVVGDNLRHSRDSRHFGPLPLALVTGKVVGVVELRYPFIRTLRDPFLVD